MVKSATPKIYKTKNTVKLLLMGNVIEERKKLSSIEQRKNSSAEETLKQPIIKVKARANT